MNAFLKKFSLRTKILVVSWSFLIPVLFLLYLTITAYDKDIQFSQQEQKGMVFLRPAVALLRLVPQHHQLRQSILGSNRGDRLQLEELAKQIDAEMVKLQAAQKAVGEDLQFTTNGLASRKRERSSVEAVNKEWKLVKGFNKGDIQDLSVRYRNFIADIRGMVAHAGDTSNLILDPDLDSYYLMDVVLLAIPQNLDRLDLLESFLRSIQRSPKKDFATQAAVFEAMTRESDIDRIGADLQTALAEDANFYGTNDIVQTKILPGFNAYKEGASPLLSGLLNINESFSADALISHCQELRKSSSELWLTSAAALDGLLSTRIQSYADKKRTALIVSSVLMSLLTAFSFIIISRISNSIEYFARAVSSESESLAKVSDLMDAAVQEAAMATTEQSAATQETVSSMEEMGSMLAVTTQNASSTLTEASQSSEEVERGKAVVNDMVYSMNLISASNEQLQGIVKVIEDIKSKTKIINDIAFETRLLAFNASIEAARAGAHGRGFAVVAEEVGKLASVSSKAADEVRSLLDGSVSQVSSVLDETRVRVEQGQKTSSACSDTFTRMHESVKRITLGTERIASAAREQGTGVRQTNLAMQEMEKVSQSNARNAERIAAQSAQLRSAADALRSNASGMYTLVLGNATSKTIRSSKPNSRPSSHASDSSRKLQNHPRQESDNPPPVRFPRQANDQQDVSETAADSQLDRNDSRWRAS